MKRIVLHAAAALAVAAVAATTASARAQDESTTAAPAAQVNIRPGAATTPSAVVVTPTRDIVTTEEKSPNGGLITSGVVMLGATYGASVVVAAASSRPGDNNLYIPLAGPWIDLANRGECRGGGAACNNETVNKVLLVADGIFQGAGALQILAGFVFPQTRIVTRAAAVKPGVHFAPSAGLGSVGMQAYGAF